MIPVIDLHCDTLSKLCSAPSDFLLPSVKAHAHITLPGLRASGTLLQCFALFTDLADLVEETSLSHIKKQYACFRHFIESSDGAMAPVFSYKDILENQSQGTLSALLTLEESCLTDTPIDLLPDLYSLGVRMATLTWNHPNLLGYPSSAPQGLTPMGFDFLSEAERLGIILDVSHLSDAGFYDVATHCHKPFLASHSNARAVCNVPRNLSDDMLRTLAAHGGVSGLNLHEPFLFSTLASPEELLAAFVQHAKHIISVAGVDTLAIGTDFDGIPGNAAIPNVTYLSRLEDALKKAGLTSDVIEKIFYRNALRVLKECL